MPNRSLHLTDQEEALTRELAELNGASFNWVVRVALRQLLGLSAPKLELPEPANK